MYEIEAKYRLDSENLEELKTKLENAGARWKGEVIQNDSIFHHESTNSERIIEGDKIFRLRREIKDGVERILLTLKVQQEAKLASKEYESLVGNYDQVRGMLSEMGYRHFVDVNKRRIKGTLDKYNLCVDEVGQLGHFLEIEMLSEDKVDPYVVKNAMIERMNSIGLITLGEVNIPYDTQVSRKNKK